MPGAAGAEDQLLRAERSADRGRDGVRVDVEDDAGVVRGHRADDRHQAGVQLLADHGRIDRDDVADEAVVHRLAVDLDRRAAVGAHEPRIHAREAHGVDAELAAGGEDARVDEAVQHHGRRVDRAVVGDAAAAHHARLDAERALHLVELRAAAVHQHDADAEVVQDRDLLDQRAGARRGRRRSRRPP